MQQLGNYFTPYCLVSEGNDLARDWPRWVAELTWKVHWTGQSVDSIPVFKTERLFSNLTCFARISFVDSEVLVA